MLTTDQITRLLDIGLCACHSGAVYEGRTIFDGILKFRPGNVAAFTGKALSHIVVDEFQAAEEILQKQVLTKNPEDAEAKAMLGLCFLLSGRLDESRAILGTIAAQKNASGQLARDLLAGLD